MTKFDITTRRLVLTPLGTEYLSTVNAYALDPENTRMMCFLPNRDAAETLEFLRAVEADWAMPAPTNFEFAILLEGQHIGAVSITFEENDGAELGWILHRDWWGHGYAAEAAKGVIDHFASLGHRHFFARCDTQNTASYKTMEKLGMTRSAEYGGRRNRASTEDSFEYRYDLKL